MWVVLCCFMFPFRGKLQIKTIMQTALRFVLFIFKKSFRSRLRLGLIPFLKMKNPNCRWFLLSAFTVLEGDYFMFPFRGKLQIKTIMQTALRFVLFIFKKSFRSRLRLGLNPF